MREEMLSELEPLHTKICAVTRREFVLARRFLCYHSINGVGKPQNSSSQTKTKKILTDHSSLALKLLQRFAATRQFLVSRPKCARKSSSLVFYPVEE